MTHTVKQTIKSWLEAHDKSNGSVPSLTKEEKADRMLRIKAAITLCNDLEKSNIFHKLKVIYPHASVTPIIVKK